MLLVTLIIGGLLGTVLRYGLCLNFKGKLIDGLLMSNIIGIIYAFIMISITPILVVSFSGSLTSFSSLVKNSYKNYSYLVFHLFIYILLSIFLSLLI